jgi:hypothetical protein
MLCSPFPSPFVFLSQDYALAAVVAVAGHLMKAGLGEDYGLGRLAARHGFKPEELDQVCVCVGGG